MSERIACRRTLLSPFLKELCQVLSYKSKVDLTGVYCRWILKMKVKSTFFTDFLLFSHGVDLEGFQTCRLSAPLRRHGHWPCEVAELWGEFDFWIILDRIGSCSRQVTLSWQFGFRKSGIAVSHFCSISPCSCLSFLGAISKSPFSIGSFRNPSKNWVEQDVKGEQTHTNHPGPAPKKSNGRLQNKDVPIFRWCQFSKLAYGSHFVSGNSDDRFRFGLTLWKKADRITSSMCSTGQNDKISPVLELTMNLICRILRFSFELRDLFWAPCSATVLAKQAMRLYAPFHKADILICHRLTVYHQSICHDFPRKLQKLMKFMLISPTSDFQERESINESTKSDLTI